MPGLELLTYELDNRSVLRALSEINAAIAGSEKNAVGSNEKIAASFQRVEDFIGKVTDKQFAANERLVQSIERRAAAENKSPVDRLIAQREQYIKRLSGEEEQIKRVTAAYEKLIEAEKKRGGSESGLGSLGETVKSFIEAPFQTAGSAAKSLLAELGPMGIAVAGVSAAMVAAGVAGFEMAKHFAEDAEQLSRLSQQTGISITTLDKWRAMAKLTGGDIDSLARAGSSMATTLDTGGEKAKKLEQALERLKISTVDLSGKQKEGGELIEQLLPALAKIPDATERIALANEVLGTRVARNFLPMIANYNELKKTVDELGFGNKEALDKAKEAAEQLNLVAERWDMLKRKLSEPIIGLITIKAHMPAWMEKFLAYDKQTHDLPGKEAELEEARKKIEGYRPAPIGQRDAAADELAVQTRLRHETTALSQQYLDPVEKLKARMKELQEEVGILNKSGIVAIKDQAQFSADLQQIAKLEQQIKAVTEAQRQQKSIQEALTKLQTDVQFTLAHPYGLSKTDQKLKTITEMPGITPEEIAKAAGILTPERIAENKALIQKALGESRAAMKKIADEVDKNEIKGERPDDRLFQLQLKQSTEQAEKSLKIYTAEWNSTQKLSQQQEETAAKVGGTSDRGIDAQERLQERLLSIKMKYADQAYQHELSNAEGLHQFDGLLEEARQAARIKHSETIAELEQQQALQTAELYRKEIDAISAPLERLFTTLFTKPKDFSKQLTTVIKTETLKPITEGLSHMTASVLQPIIYGADGKSGLAGASRGLFGGQTGNPLKLSTDANTQSTDANTQALVYLTGMIAGSTGQPAPPVPSGTRTPISVPSIGPGSAVSVGGAFTGIPSISALNALSGGSTAVPAGSVTSSIDYGQGNINLGGSVFGGPNIATPPFVTSSGGSFYPGGMRGAVGRPGGFNLGALKSGFNPAQWGIGTASTNTKSVGMYGDTISDSGTTFGSVLTSPAAASLMTSVGMPLTTAGLFGNNRGTSAGFAESTIGGAMTGAGIGTEIMPGLGTAIGAGIGAGVGALASGIEALTGDISPANKAKKYVKQDYGVTISNQMANQIASIAQSKYGGNVNVAVRSPEVRQMLGVYAAGTGQSNSKLMSSTTPHAGSLAESGGQLYQQATYQYGQAYTFGSSLPTLGGIPSQQIPTGQAGPTNVSLSLNMDGKSAGDFMAGNVVTPDFVANQSGTAQDYSNGVVPSAALMQQVPGLLVS